MDAGMNLPGPACLHCSRTMGSMESYYRDSVGHIYCKECVSTERMDLNTMALIEPAQRVIKLKSSTRSKGSGHYKHGAIEPIDYIFAHRMGFAEGNVVKYITRYKHSGKGLEDLRKALHYLEMLIEDVERNETKGEDE